MSTSGLSLADLRAANIQPDKEWNVGSEPVSLSFRGNELAGETGEACNILKKLERERLGIPGSRSTREALADELADIVICADLTAMDLGIDLGAAVSRKFDETSEKYGLSTRLAQQPVNETWMDERHGSRTRRVELHPVAAIGGNSLVLLQGRTGRLMTHGGPRTYREFALYANGVLMRSYREGSPDSNWSYDEQFDRFLAEDVALFEQALRCKVVRGKDKRAA